MNSYWYVGYRNMKKISRNNKRKSSAVVLYQYYRLYTYECIAPIVSYSRVDINLRHLLPLPHLSLDALMH